MASLARYRLISTIGGLLAPLGEMWGRIGVPTGVSVSISLGWTVLPDTSVLHAVPKKRTSHQKKRQRQLAGNNQQKPLRNLTRCPSCGHVKRAHTLCMNCVREIRKMWRAEDQAASTKNNATGSRFSESSISQNDVGLNFPKRLNRPNQRQEKLADKQSYIPRRARSLVFPDKRK